MTATKAKDLKELDLSLNPLGFPSQGVDGPVGPHGPAGPKGDRVSIHSMCFSLRRQGRSSMMSQGYYSVPRCF